MKQHGDDATVVADQRADELLHQGDLNGHRIWKRMLAAMATSRTQYLVPESDVTEVQALDALMSSVDMEPSMKPAACKHDNYMATYKLTISFRKIVRP